MLELKKASLGLLVALSLLSSGAYASSTIVVGKKASSTGHVLLAQNEDLRGRSTIDEFRTESKQFHWNDTVSYIKTCEIPQVPHTLGYHLTITRSQTSSGALQTSRAFVNDAGVVILTNNLEIQDLVDKPTTVIENGLISKMSPKETLSEKESNLLRYITPNQKEVTQLLKETKSLIGKKTAVDESRVETYIDSGIARLMAERGRSAKQAVEALADLIFIYGYQGQFREFFVADKDEAFIASLAPGHTLVAKRIKDNEVFFSSEVSGIGEVNLLDSDRVITSKWTRIRAQKLLEEVNEREKAKKLKLTREVLFNPANFVDPPTVAALRGSMEKTKLVLDRIASIQDKAKFSGASSIPGVIPTKLLDRQTLKTILRTKGAVTSLTNTFTQRSAVYEIREKPEFTLIEKTFGNPSILPYLPAHPLSMPTNWNSREPLYPRPNFNFSLRRNSSLFSLDAGLFSLSQSKNTLSPTFAEFEKKANMALNTAYKEANFLEEQVSSKKAQRVLNSFDAKWEILAKSAVETDLSYAPLVRVSILSDAIDTSERTLKLVIYSNKKFDATSIVRESLKFGHPAAAASDGTPRFAQSTSLVRRDFDGDGLKDAVITFNIKNFRHYLTKNLYSAMFVEGTTTDGKAFCGFDSVDVR